MVECVIAIFLIPTIVSGFSDNCTPHYTVLIVLIGVAIVVYAVKGQSEYFTLDISPDVIIRVFSRYIG